MKGGDGGKMEKKCFLIYKEIKLFSTAFLP
jgi:hypothetical protein